MERETDEKQPYRLASAQLDHVSTNMYVIALVQPSATDDTTAASQISTAHCVHESRHAARGRRNCARSVRL